MRPFFENNVLQQQPFKPMIIVVDTTKAGSASNTFVLPIIKNTTETVKIYWGDGTNSIGANGDNTHVYVASGVYTVKIESRLFGGIYFNNLGDKAKITKIRTFGDAVHRLVTNAFYSCTSLNECSADIKTIATSSANMFRSNTALTTVPLINISTVTNTDTMFSFCTFATVPLFNTSKVTSAGSMFSFCASLTTVPLFNLSSCTNATFMFRSCALTTVPLFDLSNCANTSNMFYDCASLTTVPLFNLSNCTNATNMFFGVTLTTTSYSDFLINLATLPLRSGVTFSGGNSKYNVAGGVARAYLVSNFGWTITDGGAA